MRIFASTLVFISVFFYGCKSDSESVPQSQQTEEMSEAMKIASAHGYNNWDKVASVAFTFAVDRDSIKGNGRNWEWYPKNDSVVLNTPEKVFSYKRTNIDSTLISVDKAFINDKYWFMVPFQLIWDKSATISDPQKVTSPIRKEALSMITITYPSEGGYTPGDAYDIYYDDSYIIREWTYRKGNSELPSLSTTFETYQNFNGIKIAQDHKQEGGNWNLNFTNVKIDLD